MTLRTPHDAFLEAIAESPDDDGPRLIYADWLEEQGQDERAEFIRCQCLLQRWLDTPSTQPGGTAEDGGPAGAALAISQQLEELHGLSWLPRSLMDLESEAAKRACVYRRGFVESVTCPCQAWLTHGPDILAACPTVREVRLSDCQPISARHVHAPGSRPRRAVWVYPRGLRGWPVEFDDAVNLHHRSEQVALDVMSRCCLAYARAELARRRTAVRGW